MIPHSLTLRNRRAWRRLISICSIVGLLLPSIAFPGHAYAVSAPVVTAPASITMNEGGIISFMVRASDPDGDAITSLTASPLPPGASLTTGSPYLMGIFGWSLNFNQAGIYDITFTATSGSPTLSGSTTTHIVVTDVDRAPLVTAPATQSVTENSLLTFTISASDPDGQSITSLTATPLPSGAAFTPNAQNTSGTFSWTPAVGQAGTYNITFSATNALVGTGTTGVGVLPIPGPGNHAPVFDAISPVTIQARTSARIPFTVRDQDLDTLSVGLSPIIVDPDINRTLSIHPTLEEPGLFQGELWVTPDPADYGTDIVVNLFATDDVGYDYASVTITILANNPPVIDTIPDITVNWGDSVAQNFIATDQDLDDLTVRVVNNNPSNPATIFELPNIIGTYSGQLRWTPNDPHFDQFTPQVCVSDGLDETCQTVFIAVSVPSVQDPVAILQVAPTEVCTSDPVTFDLTDSYDPDGTLTHGFGHFGDGEGWGSAPAPGWLYFTHAYATAGTYTSDFFVFDDFPVSPNGSNTAYGPIVTVMDPVLLPAPTPNPTITLDGADELTLTFPVVGGNFDPTHVDLDLASTILKYTDGVGSVHTINPINAQATATAITFTFGAADLETMFASLSHVHTVPVTLSGTMLNQACDRISMNANLVVDRPNRAPVITNMDDITIQLEAASNGVYQSSIDLPFTITDEDGDTLDTPSRSGNAFPDLIPTRAFLSFTSSSPGLREGRLRWFSIGLEDVGVFNGTICGSDFSLQDCTSFTITVLAPSNQSPVADFTSGPSYCTGMPVNFDGRASRDPGGYLASQSWDFGDGLPGSTTLQSSHTYSNAGNYSVELQVTDNDGTASSISKAVQVTDPQTTPSFADDIFDLQYPDPYTQVVDRGVLYENCLFFDIDCLLYNNYMIYEKYPGGYAIILDGAGATFDVTRIHGANLPVDDPALESIDISYTDQDGSRVTVHPSLVLAIDGSALPTPRPEGAAVLFVNLPTENFVSPSGNQTADVAVDISGLIDDVPDCNRFTSTTNVHVKYNHEPVLSFPDLIENQHLTVDRRHGYTFDLQASDADNDQLTFKRNIYELRFADPDPDLQGATLDSATGTFRWSVPPTARLGDHHVEFCVLDPYELMNCKILTFTVVNIPPVTTVSVLTPAPLCAGDPVKFSGTTTDIDGTIAQMTWDFGDNTTPATGLSVEHAFTTAGTYQSALTATDNDGGNGSASIPVTITKTVKYSASIDGSDNSLVYNKNKLAPANLGIFISPDIKKAWSLKDLNFDPTAVQLSAPSLTDTTIAAKSISNNGLITFDSDQLVKLFSNLPQSGFWQTVDLDLTIHLTTNSGCDRIVVHHTISVMKDY